MKQLASYLVAFVGGDRDSIARSVRTLPSANLGCFHFNLRVIIANRLRPPLLSLINIFNKKFGPFFSTRGIFFLVTPKLAYANLYVMGKEPEIKAEDIKKFRAKKGLTQQQLASALNVSVTTVSRWEGGLKEPSGSAAAILKSLIAGGLGGVGLLGGIAGLGLNPLLTSGRSIYQLLKETFEGKEEQ